MYRIVAQMGSYGLFVSGAKKWEPTMGILQKRLKETIHHLSCEFMTQKPKCQKIFFPSMPSLKVTKK